MNEVVSSLALFAESDAELHFLSRVEDITDEYEYNQFDNLPPLAVDVDITILCDNEYCASQIL